MISNPLFDLRHYRLTVAAEDCVVWHPTAAVYFIRLVVVLLFWILLGILWLFTVETPWGWESRRERESLRRQVHNEAVDRALKVFSESGISIDGHLHSVTESSPTEAEWQLQVPAWLKAITLVSLVLGFYWPVCTFWNRIVLWRDDRNAVWIRFWYLWPRRRRVGVAGSTRLIVRAMQVHHFSKRLHTGTRWYWILQVSSQMVPSIPSNPSAVGLTWRIGIPDFLVADQNNPVSHNDSLPREVQIAIARIVDTLGILTEELRIIPQEIEWSKIGRPIRISREKSEVRQING